MRNIKLTLVLLFSLTSLSAQVIVTNPIFPKQDEPLTIVFNAAEGNGGLAGFSGDIWAHTGVITNYSTSPADWKYVIAGWSENTDRAKLKSLGNDLWELEIGPDIKQFYGVPQNEKVESLAFVFRNTNGSITGRAADGGDIFVPVYEEGLFVNISQPASEFLLVDPGQSFQIKASATFADSMQLFLNEELRYQIMSKEIDYALTVPDQGVHEVIIRAYFQGEMVSDSFSFLVKGSENTEDVPPGLKQGANYISDTEVTLVLYAPEKEIVFLIGDFNDWKINTDYLMTKSPDGNYFWLTLSGLESGKEYIYQYFVDGTIRIADPYTNKTSDPWDDQYIDEKTYPGLIDYPAGKTTFPASVFQTNQQEYVWDIPDFQAPDQHNLLIYELLIRDFIDDHSFEGLIDTLDYLENLGITAIELMPVSEFEGNDSWGYNPSFYFAVDKYYGPAHTFKAFVDSAHRRGIAVIMDMVLNHSYGQSPLARLYWDSENNRPAANNPWYNEVSPNSVYSWGSDFNHESEDTKAFVDSVNSYWLTEFNVDGFRFDFTKGFTNSPGEGSPYDASRIAILKRMADKIWSVNPDAYIILEHFCVNEEEIQLADYGMMTWANANRTYGIASKGYLSGGLSNFIWIASEFQGFQERNYVGFMESHDEERLMVITQTDGNYQNANHNVRESDIALKRMELCANFFIPFPGPKMIWMFGELGYDYSIDYNGRVGRKPIRWDYFDQHNRKRLYQVYSELGKLKKTYPVFQSEDVELVLRDTVKRIHLNHEEMNVTILGNFSTWEKKGQGGFQHTGWWYDFWTGDSLFVENTDAWMTFYPSEYRFYTDVKLNKPDILSGTGRLYDTPETSKIHVYPNPIGQEFTLYHSGKDALTVEIVTVHGQKLWQNDYPSGMPESLTIDSSKWPKGVLFCIVKSKDRIQTVKLIK